MVAQLNAYRRAKDQSEARVRELAAELAEAAKDSRAWQSQARRVALGVADAKSSIHPPSDASAREASTPRPSRGGGAPVYLVASDGDVATATSRPTATSPTETPARATATPTTPRARAEGETRTTTPCSGMFGAAASRTSRRS